jgi:hypothetical protein
LRWRVTRGILSLSVRRSREPPTWRGHGSRRPHSGRLRPQPQALNGSAAFSMSGGIECA